MPVPGEYLYIPLLVLLYLIIDLMMEVEKLPLLLRNLFFWLYWVVYSIAAEVAACLTQLFPVTGCRQRCSS